MEEKEILLRRTDGATVPALLARRENDPTCWLRLVGEGVEESSTGPDYFESFVPIRRRLAKRGIFPLCYAASRDVWPSAMARDMGQGLAAYKLRMGRPGEELVRIFDTGPDVDPVTPEEQKAFSLAWFASLG